MVEHFHVNGEKWKIALPICKQSWNQGRVIQFIPEIEAKFHRKIVKGAEAERLIRKRMSGRECSPAYGEWQVLQRCKAVYKVGHTAYYALRDIVRGLGKVARCTDCNIPCHRWDRHKVEVQWKPKDSSLVIYWAEYARRELNVCSACSFKFAVNHVKEKQWQRLAKQRLKEIKRISRSPDERPDLSLFQKKAFKPGTNLRT